MDDGTYSGVITKECLAGGRVNLKVYTEGQPGVAKLNLNPLSSYVSDGITFSTSRSVWQKKYFQQYRIDIFNRGKTRSQAETQRHNAHTRKATRRNFLRFLNRKTESNRNY